MPATATAGEPRPLGPGSCSIAALQHGCHCSCRPRQSPPPFQPTRRVPIRLLERCDWTVLIECSWADDLLRSHNTCRKFPFRTSCLKMDECLARDAGSHSTYRGICLSLVPNSAQCGYARAASESGFMVYVKDKALHPAWSPATKFSFYTPYLSCKVCNRLPYTSTTANELLLQPVSCSPVIPTSCL